MTYPAWLVPLLLALGVTSAGLTIVGRPSRIRPAWAVVTVTLGIVAAVLVLVAALQ